ncbi:hypothetical protein RB195_026464 [Necator americanus]|uniref:Uncharacterized protein n=1 Tax=Necator americanus TaxID=51031 RepID=A0ABR1EX90_NECAM
MKVDQECSFLSVVIHKMMRAFMLTEPQEEELDFADDSEKTNEENVERTNSVAEGDVSNRSRFSESYKYDVQERLKETLERMRSGSFDDTVCLPASIPNVVLNEVLQCCFKKKASEVHGLHR